MKAFLLNTVAFALFQACAFGNDEVISSSEFSSTGETEGGLRGTAEFAKTLDLIATIDENDSEGHFSMSDLVVFASDCYNYPTASEKRECQRSMKRFERCMDTGTFRQCCRNADQYQRQLRCGSSTPPPPGNSCGSSCGKNSDCFTGGFIQCGVCYDGVCSEDTCSRYCPSGKNSECKSDTGYQNCGKCDTRYAGTRYQCYDP